MTFTPFDQMMMQRCIDLARNALGHTAPNPLVGAVIVQGTQVVGEGFHAGAGQPHAEVVALQEAGEQARGATIYVNLEPCDHYGRTPPCTEALILAGVAKVVVGMIDPDPRVSGTGVARLQEAGIEVLVGLEEEECEALNEFFIHRSKYQRPFGILKYAMTLDGKIATSTGHSAWVTEPDARAEVHELRTLCDGVIVGGNTVRRDNPLLTTHDLSDNNPLRVVMSRNLDLPLEAQLWSTTEASTVVFTEGTLPETGPQAEVRSHLQHQGVEIVALPALTPAAVMTQLYDRGLLSVLWECGGTLAAQAIADGAVQKVWAFVAPKIIGGETAPSPIGDLGLQQMTEAIQLEQVSWREIGQDLLLEGYLPTSPSA